MAKVTVSAGQAVTRQQREAQLTRQTLEVPKGYADKFTEMDLTKQKYPYAISHSAGFHGSLHTHISEMKSRIEAYMGERGLNANGTLNKLGKNLSGVMPHLNAALDALGNSYSAHAVGFQDGPVAFHTANVHFQKAIGHVADANRVLTRNLGAGSQHFKGLFKDQNWQGRVLTSDQLGKLGSDYQEHLKSVALNAKMAMPKGTLSENVSSPSAFGDLTEAGKAVESKAAPKLDESTATQSTVSSVVSRVKTVDEQRRERAQKSGSTFTLEAAQRATAAAATGIKTKRTSSPFEGVGLTGFKDIQEAAARHFEFNNPGQSFWHSEHAVSPAKVMDYATTNKVGVGQDYRTKLAETMRKTGLTPKGAGAEEKPEPNTDITSKLMAETYSEPAEEPAAVKKARQRKVEFEGGKANG